MPVNFTSSNAPPPKGPFDQSIPDRIPFSQNIEVPPPVAVSQQNFQPPPDTERDMTDIVDLLNRQRLSPPKPPLVQPSQQPISQPL